MLSLSLKFWIETSSVRIAWQKIITKYNWHNACHCYDLPVVDQGADDDDVGDAKGQAEGEEAAEEASAMAGRYFCDVDMSWNNKKNFITLNSRLIAHADFEEAN